MKVLLTGGARSGKSRVALQFAQPRHVTRTFVATAEGHDDEMLARIDAHRLERGRSWTTLEHPIDIAGALGREGIIVVDCLTLWVSNVMLANDDDALVFQHFATLERALTRSQADVVLITNEVGCGVVPATPLGRRFRDLQGTLNQRVARACDTVVWMVSGIPVAIKGTLDPAVLGH